MEPPLLKSYTDFICIVGFRRELVYHCFEQTYYLTNFITLHPVKQTNKQN